MKAINFNSNDVKRLESTDFSINDTNDNAVKTVENHSVSITKTTNTNYDLYVDDKLMSHSYYIEDLIFSISFFIETFEDSE